MLHGEISAEDAAKLTGPSPRRTLGRLAAHSARSPPTDGSLDVEALHSLSENQGPGRRQIQHHRGERWRGQEDARPRAVCQCPGPAKEQLQPPEQGTKSASPVGGASED